MAAPEADSPAIELDEEETPAPRSRRGRLVLAGGVAVVALALGIAWIERYQIAQSVISGQLDQRQIPASYRISDVGVDRLVLSNLIAGDPRHPDLRIERVEISLGFPSGLPGISGVRLIRPRLGGTVDEGKVSFGSLDPLIYTRTGEPFRWPAMNLEVVDGQAWVIGGFGTAIAHVEGKGHLRDDFNGKIAVSAPTFTIDHCKGEGADFFGSLSINEEQAHVAGPLRLRKLACAGGGPSLERGNVALTARFSPAMDSANGNLVLAAGRLGLDGQQAEGLSGKSDFTWRDGGLTARYRLAANGIRAGGVKLERLEFDGALRARDNFARADSEGTLAGSGFSPDGGLDAALAEAEKSGADTLLAPLLGQVRSALRREAKGSKVAGQFLARADSHKVSISLTDAELRGGSGAQLLALSRFQAAGGENTGVTGNFVTGGAGLPHFEGSFTPGRGGATRMHLRLADYRAGESRLAIPGLDVTAGRDGALAFSGAMRLSGALPGGSTQDLDLPLQGTWSEKRGLAAWQRCTRASFARLELGDLALDPGSIEACPASGGAIVQSGRGINARLAPFALTGLLGSGPIELSGAEAVVSNSTGISARGLQVALGSGESRNRFAAAEIAMQPGSFTSGTFSGGEMRLGPVPLDLTEASGELRIEGSDISIAGASFRVADRQRVPRFQPLVAHDATARIAGGRVTAEAMLREPASEREVVQADIVHLLSSEAGYADLKVPGIVFDQRLQPEALSGLTLGIVANAAGTITGEGRIDWNGQGITSTGRFHTDGVDFAAPFGPTKGVSGTVEFTDLLGLVTAPDQRLRIASINPGVEVTDGEVSFALLGDNVLAVNGADWPFLDGTMRLLPTRMVLGASEVRRYELMVKNVNAAKFVQRMEMSNISANGFFDGSLPLVFDQNGGRIEGGFLSSRPPGGNLSYVGELSYRDLTPMANFAFQSLRSLDYRSMQVTLDGSLEGEIVTKVSFEGIRQGKEAKRNLVTRAMARLPIRFNVNIRAPFYQLITSFKAMYDPTYVRDPRLIGLLGADGQAVPKDGTSPARTIQQSVSEPKP